MEIAENIRRIKDNLFLIPEERFDELTKDTEYATSFVYLLACFILSIPFTILIAFFSRNFFGIIIDLPFSLVLAVIAEYISFGVMHILLKLLGGKANFLKTVQVFVYGGTISIILSPLPLIGFFAALIALANVVIGSKRIHQISLLRAILAVIVIPITLAIVLFVLLFILAFIGTFSAFNILSF